MIHKVGQTIARSLAFSVIGLIVVVMVAMLAGRDSARATSFTPSLSLALANTAPSANSDINGVFDLPEPDSQFGDLVAFTPAAFGVAAGNEMATGAVVGTLSSVATLGLLGSGCWQKVVVNFALLNASTNTATTIDAYPPGTPDQLAPLAKDANSNGIVDGAERYPSYLNTLFPGLTPRARYFGANNTDVTGTTVILNFLVFEPGTVFPAPALTPPPPPLPAPDASLGFTSVTVLQDPSVPVAPSPVSDFCSSLHSETTTFGLTRDNPCTPYPGDPRICPVVRLPLPTGATTPDESGGKNRTNPADGVYNFSTFARSQRDADNDGVENGLDACPSTADPTFNPRLSESNAAYAGDDDKDGIPNSCDPTRTENSNLGDHDNDFYLNRGDNCPLVKNDDNLDSDFDGIGDACDSNTTTADGHRHDLCLTVPITVGAGGTAPTGTVPLGDTSCPKGVLGTGGTGTGGTGGTGTGGTGTGGDAVGGAATGVGSLAPAVASIPAWAAIASGLGGTGLLGLAASAIARVLRRRR